MRPFPRMNTLSAPSVALLASITLLSQSLLANDWPQWRGADRSDRSPETGLLKSWPESGPKRVWLMQNAGIGYSGFAVAKGRVYTLGARGQQEFLIALSAKDGKEVWAAPIGEIYPNNWGDGPRGTPTVDGDFVYGLAANGGLICVAAADGKAVWQVKMQDFGGTVPGWGYCESVVVDGKQVVCTPGSKKGSLVALDKKTGRLLWHSKDFTEAPHYSSIVPVHFNGIDQYVQLTPKAVVGVKAIDGSVLWQSPWAGTVAVIPTPIWKDGYVYITSGYGAGCKLVKVGKDYAVSDVYENKVMKNHHGGVVLGGDHLYGHSDGAGWVCQEFLTGKEVWSSKNFGKGAVTYADGMLYCVDESSGAVALVEASPKGWNEHSRFKLEPQTTLRKPEGRIWTHPVISNGKLYLRDQDLIYCFDVKGK